MTTPPYTADRRIVLTRANSARAIVAMLAVSAVMLAIAPFFMPDSYDWIEHTTSESAGQGVTHSWIARTGFVIFGFAVILLAKLAGRRWGLAGRIAHRIFGVAIIGAAVYASMAWDGSAFIELEDQLHSWASGIVGFSFIVGVLIVLLRRPIADQRSRWYDWFAMAVALSISVAIFAAPGVAGVLQRGMFLAAYLWYLAEALKSAQTDPHSSEAMAERMAA